MTTNPTSTLDADSLAQRVIARERRALAKALSVLESGRPEDRKLQHRLIDLFYPRSGNAWRIGITGSPGAGKSTLIEALGTHIVSQGRTLAVLSIDPAGATTGGSILGDKLRMTTLANHPNAYIRPSSNRGSGTALSLRLRESIIACEAAGYDTIIVETVGTGQSDTAIADVTDMVIVATLPNAGDEVQSIKRGIIELADVVIVTKSDIDPAAAQRATAQIRSALQLIPPRHPDWQPVVLSVSSIRGDGISQLWNVCCQFFAPSRSATIEKQRRHQRLVWLERALLEQLYRLTEARTDAALALDAIQTAVESGQLPPPLAADELFSRYFSSLPSDQLNTLKPSVDDLCR